MAAIWSEVWWVGCVKEVMENDEYAVKFMHPVQGSKHNDWLIDWPAIEDITAIPHGDILCVLSEPVPSMYKSRWCKTLPKKELETVKEMFSDYTYGVTK